ncbi:MAG: CD1107 family mobile element protein [Ruminococcus sp.]
MKKKQKAQAGNRRMPENKKAASRVGLTFSEKSLMQGISILPFLQWTMPEICREVYKTANPYYTDPEAEDSNESNPAKQLPVSAEATKPSSATGQVTEHTKTDSEGNTTSETSLAEQKKAAMQEADASEQAENNAEQSENGKEFYTIQTASDKVFYLIIDRDGDEEMVYFRQRSAKMTC